MKTYTPLQTLKKFQRELWGSIRLLISVRTQLDEQSDSRIEVCEVEKVLRAMAGEIGRIIGREGSKVPNPRNIRQGEDFALKAQLAKARQAVASALKEREDWPSDK
jgi:hypothetical protein